MRVLQAKTKRPLDLLAVGAGGHVAAASTAFGAPGDVSIWEAASGRLSLTHRASERDLSSLVFHPDGKRLFLGLETSLVVLDVHTRKPFDTTDRISFPEFAVSASGTRILITYQGRDGRDGVVGLRELDVAEDAPVSLDELWVEGNFMYSCPAVAPDATRVAVALHDGFRDRVRNNLQVRNAANGKVHWEVEFGGANPLEEIVFSANGSKVLARSSGRTVKVFDAATGKPVGELLHPGRPYVTGTAVHPNGTVACSRNNGTVSLWNLDRMELVRTLDWKLGKLVSVAFSPDGSIGSAGTEDGQVIVWDVDV